MILELSKYGSLFCQLTENVVIRIKHVRSALFHFKTKQISYLQKIKYVCINIIT